MKFTFQKQYKSIKQFNEFSVDSSFVVLTGSNGSGKTHFLTAVANRFIRADVITSDRDVKYFDWNTFAPNDSEVTSTNKPIPRIYSRNTGR